MNLSRVLAVLIFILVVLVFHFRKEAEACRLSSGQAEATTWSAVRDSWGQLRGETLNMVVAGDAGAAATAWVTRNAPHGKGGSMGRADAEVVCQKACGKWKDGPSVAAFCDCATEAARDF